MARWGMVIDLDRCTGCQACVVACKVENNVSPTGAEEAEHNRSISWIRLANMSLEGHAQARTELQLVPIPCMHWKSRLM